MSTNRKHAKVSDAKIQDQLIAEGCDGDFLNELLALYRWHCEKARHKRQIGRSKSLSSQLTKLASRIVQAQRDTEQRHAESLHVLAGRSVATAAPWLQKKLNPPHFEEAAALIRSHAEQWKEIVDHIMNRTGRRDSKDWAVKMIHVYCCIATHQEIPPKRIADLLCDSTNDADARITEGAVREALRRTTKLPPTPKQDLAGSIPPERMREFCEQLADPAYIDRLRKAEASNAGAAMRGEKVWMPADQEWVFAANLIGAAMRKEKVWDFTRNKLKERHANKT